MIETAADHTTYKVVFDIADAGYRQWSFAAFALPFVALGILLLALQSRLAPRWPRFPRRGVLWLWLGFSLFWTVIAFGTTFGEYVRLTSAVRSRQVQWVEGPVEDFVPMPYEGHAMESFSVHGKRFEYSDYFVTSGFNKTASHGGPITAGRLVRVGYVGDAIVRLEVAE